MSTRDTNAEARASLTRGQTAILASATVPMMGFGALGAWGTYSNITSVFHRSATALGVVAAGEGATLVLALVLVGLTMLGQSSPAAVRVGLWTLPAVASCTGAAVAQSATEAVVFAVTPMAMCVSAEGLGLLARRIVVYRTGADMEAQRRNAETMQRLAYHRARAANHPSKGARKRSERASWRLARRVGVGDAELGAHLVQVQRDRLREGADAALVDMFGVPSAPELPAIEEPLALQRHDLVTTEVTAPAPVVAPKVDLPKPQTVVTRLDFDDFTWKPSQTIQTAAALPAQEPRQVVTEKVADTPSELRRKARRLHKQLVAETGRGVTIDRLREEFGLSRRDATELRREVVTEAVAR